MHPQDNAQPPASWEEVHLPLQHDCPACGAKVGTRCRLLGPNATYPVRTKVDVRRKPCAERVMVAWREWISR